MAFLCVMEGLGLVLGAAFETGRIAAGRLIDARGAEEIARSGRRRLIPLRIGSGMLLLAARLTVLPAPKEGRWDHVVLVLFGTGLVAAGLWDAWRFWIAPRLRPKTPISG